MKRFLTGLKIGALLVAGLSCASIWIEMTDVEIVFDLIPVIAGALLVGLAFAIRSWHLPVITVAAIVVYWWQTDGFAHFFGYPADGFARTVAWSAVAIAAIAGAIVMTLRAASRNYD